MSNTEYSRSEQIRLTTYERTCLGRSVMREIESVSVMIASGSDSEEQRRYLRTLRSLLERLMD